jgi:hypothetical protein
MMLAGIDKNELVLLKFTEEEKQNKLQWKHSKEFECKGEMYDIVESRVVGDTTFYWVWWDHEETKLSKQLKELVISDLNHNPKNQDYRKKLHNFYKFLFFEEYRPDKPLFITTEDNNTLTENKLYHSHSLSPPAPPPELYF